MAKYSTFEDLDIVLESANNIESVLWNTEVWVVSYKNGLPPDRFETCEDMVDFLVGDNSD